MFHLKGEILVSHTKISYVKLWNSSCHMGIGNFICERKFSNYICCSHVKWNVKFSWGRVNTIIWLVGGNCHYTGRIHLATDFLPSLTHMHEKNGRSPPDPFKWIWKSGQLCTRSFKPASSTDLTHSKWSLCNVQVTLEVLQKRRRPREVIKRKPLQTSQRKTPYL